MKAIWTPADYREVFERAATFQAEQGFPADEAPVIDLFTREVLK